MAYLLDTHILIWLLDEPEQLSRKAYALIKTSEPLYVSIASLWEIAIKAGLEKLDLKVPFSEIYQQLLTHKTEISPIPMLHLSACKNLPLHHRDPFDRRIIAQAIANNLTLILKDKQFDQYPISVLW